MKKKIAKYKYHVLAALGLGGAATMTEFRLEPRAKDAIIDVVNTGSEAIDDGIAVIGEAIKGVEDVPRAKTIAKSMCDESGCIGITVVTREGINKRYLVTIEAQEIALETQKYGHLDDSNSIEYEDDAEPYDGFTEDDGEKDDDEPEMTLENYERRCKEFNTTQSGTENCRAIWKRSLEG